MGNGCGSAIAATGPECNLRQRIGAYRTLDWIFPRLTRFGHMRGELMPPSIFRLRYNGQCTADEACLQLRRSVLKRCQTLVTRCFEIASTCSNVKFCSRDATEPERYGATRSTACTRLRVGTAPQAPFTERYGCFSTIKRQRRTSFITRRLRERLFASFERPRVRR